MDRWGTLPDFADMPIVDVIRKLMGSKETIDMCLQWLKQVLLRLTLLSPAVEEALTKKIAR